MTDDFGIRERVFDEDGKIIFSRTQDVQGIIDKNKAEAEFLPSMHGHAAVRKVGSIPLNEAENWARECGAAIGTKEFAEYVKKKLTSGEFAAFCIKKY